MRTTTRQFSFTPICISGRSMTYQEEPILFRLTVRVSPSGPLGEMGAKTEDVLDVLSSVVGRWIKQNLEGKVLLGLGDPSVFGWATDNLRGRQPFMVPGPGDADGLAPFLHEKVLPALLGPSGLVMVGMSLQQFNRPEITYPEAF